MIRTCCGGLVALLVLSVLLVGPLLLAVDAAQSDDAVVAPCDALLGCDAGMFTTNK